LDDFPDYLPSEIAQQFAYPILKKAFLDIHQPPDLQMC